MAAPSQSQSPSGRSFLEAPSGDGNGIGKVYLGWQTRDPRASSTQSLVPSVADDERWRTLLLIYIHGFMGSDSSFRSFPAHVHSYLKETLAETHVIHTKIYPRYKTYKAIDVARDNFSRWLEPHESPTTDVVLIGHSMGGLLAADIVLIPGSAVGHPFRHRILGTVSLDSPFLGLHPGIVVSGIASIFRPAPSPANDDGASNSLSGANHDPAESLSPDSSVYSSVAPPSEASSPALPLSPPSTGPSGDPDPYFNPPFFNDVLFIDRGWFKNITHFAKKHKSQNLVGAATSHIMSHLEFGGCLADYPGLNSRYNKLRRLEDVDPFNANGPDLRGAVRVRFVNYYTISTGRLKKPKRDCSSPYLRPDAATTQGHRRSSSDIDSRASTPRISVDDDIDGGRQETLQSIEPVPEQDEPPMESEVFKSSEAATELDAGDMPDNIQLPAIPDLPEPPQPPNLDQYSEKDARKQAEKEAKCAQKAYDHAIKTREKVMQERQRLLEKRRRKTLKDAEKREKEQQREAARKGKEEQKKVLREEQALHKELEEMSRRLEKQQAKPPGEEKKKERKFCMLPRKTNGVRDSTWVQVYMEGVDEVGAHCGLFFPGAHYEKLIGDVGSRIVGWVQEDASRRAILEMREP